MHQILTNHFGIEMINKKLYRLFEYRIIDTNFFPKVENNKMGGLDWNVILDSMSTNEKRNEIVINEILKLKSRNILVLCKRRDQVQYIYDNLKLYDENVEKFFSTDRYFNCETRILVSTFSKSGVGFDFPKLDTLVLACSVLEGIEQYIGRIFRKEDTIPLIIDFRDQFNILKTHLKKRIIMYKLMGGVLIK